MDRNKFTETLTGQESVRREMPDGSIVWLTKLENGQWVTKEQHAEEAARLVSTTTRFEGDDFRPDPHRPQTVGTLRPIRTSEDENIVQSARDSLNRQDAWLGVTLGDPDKILSGDLGAVVQIRELRARRPNDFFALIGIAKILAASNLYPKWKQVVELLTKD